MVLQLTFKTDKKGIDALEQLHKNRGYDFLSTNAKTGVSDATKHKTTRWDTLKKAYSLTKWYFAKPPEKFMGHVEYDAIEKFNPDWVDLNL